MTEQDIRDLEIRIAKALGFAVVKGALYAPAPNKTLLGGHYSVHAGFMPETPEIVEGVWKDYTPRFARSMDDAMWLLDLIYDRYHLDYNLFRDNDGRHTCEIGWWADEPGRQDQLWQETGNSPALAIAIAVSKCPAVMGAHAGIED